jgi:predicted metal-dependent enzyme (double-stranded beta helix superfamily)
MPHAEPSAPHLAPLLARKRSETSNPVTPALATLIGEIDAACADGTMRDRMVAALETAAAQASLLTAEQRVPQSGCYARHPIYSDPAGRFTIVAIVWTPGQFSPIHAHHTWCAYAVYENALTETLYVWDRESGTAQPARTEVRSPGYGCYAHAGLDQIHRLGNSGAEPAISIHVYGVERERIGTHVNRVVQAAWQVA